MPIHVNKERLRDFLNQRSQASEWLLVDQRMIDAYAHLTRDRQYIHVDTERAKSSPLGATVAHGLLTLSLMPALLAPIQLRPGGGAMELFCGLDRLRFIEPVRVNSRIRARTTLINITDISPVRVLLRTRVVAEIERACKPALEAESLSIWVMDGFNNGPDSIANSE